jgi:hypothetical protein
MCERGDEHSPLGIIIHKHLGAKFTSGENSFEKKLALV